MEEDRALAENCVSDAEWAILITAGYYIPIPRGRFGQQAAWEARCGRPEREGDVTDQQASDAIVSCLSKGLIRLTEDGHKEPERNVLGRFTGEVTEYPAEGIVMTEKGYGIYNRIRIAIRGIDYYEEADGNDQPPNINHTQR
jgi:hypothetical protein